jgi:hypothetical protein
MPRYDMRSAKPAAFPSNNSTRPPWHGFSWIDRACEVARRANGEQARQDSEDRYALRSGGIAWLDCGWHVLLAPTITRLPDSG